MLLFYETGKVGPPHIALTTARLSKLLAFLSFMRSFGRVVGKRDALAGLNVLLLYDP